MTSEEKDVIIYNDTRWCYYEQIDSYSWCPDPEYATVPSTNTGATLLLTVLYSVTIAVSSYSNALVLWIVSTTKSLQNVNNFHIANLAVSDIMLALLCTPFQFWAALVQQWVLPEFMCKLCPFIQDMCVNVNIFNLILIAQDRYQAVMTPLHTNQSKKRTMHSIFLIWIIAMVLALPNTVLFQFKYIKDNALGIKPFCTAYDPSVTISVLEDLNLVHTSTKEGNGYFTSVYDFYVFVTMITQFMTPLAYLIISYSIMSIELWNSQTPGVDQDFSKRGSIKMMIAVVIVFTICWIPWHLFATIKAFWRDMAEFPTIIKPIFFICHWLAMSSGCFNPFVYALFSEKFKNELKKRTFCIRWWKYQGSPLASGCPSLRTQLDSDDSNPTNLLETKPMIRREWTIQISTFSE